MDEEFDLREVANARVAEAPWYFRLGQFLARRKIRGGERLLSEVRRRGMLDQLAEYLLGDVHFRVPLWRPCNQWLQDDVATYEHAFMRLLAATVCQLRGDVTVIDCGADIGTVSAILLSRCKNITRVVAFEPNPVAFRVLDQNVRGFPVPAVAMQAAVGSFDGHGTLVTASQDPSAHAMYIAPDDRGSITVQRVDNLDIVPGTTCAIKIDVEGTEVDVVRGASQTIRNAGELVVAFEAHPRVATRLGRDPKEVVDALLNLRSNFEFNMDTTPSRPLDPKWRIFDQVPPNRVYNVVAYSSGPTES